MSFIDYKTYKHEVQVQISIKRDNIDKYLRKIYNIKITNITCTERKK